MSEEEFVVVQSGISHEVYNAGELIVARYISDGLRFHRSDSYPSDVSLNDLKLEASLIIYQRINRSGYELLLKFDDGIINMELRSGFFNISTYAVSDEKAAELLEWIKSRAPRAEPKNDEISVTFWTLGPNGPIATSRKITCPDWDKVELNYNKRTRDGLERLMETSLDPNQGGKLVLWHGTPGTGKTYALRAWAKAWREKMDVHYIVDPEVFFGEKALYMVSVLLGADEEISGTSSPKWRLIVAEDTGELLTKDAKMQTGQSLSRLLNVCDGLIGQGLRSLVLITTNDELGTMHDAVTRPGRCLAN